MSSNVQPTSQSSTSEGTLSDDAATGLSGRDQITAQRIADAAQTLLDLSQDSRRTCEEVRNAALTILDLRRKRPRRGSSPILVNKTIKSDKDQGRK
ncbi:hypothetical protein F52700_2828 [Fusarium sp. NRRL 52700]|nr:hypothetical protein F52700_2828 [Fusarium sp. NRRL 52700]